MDTTKNETARFIVGTLTTLAPLAAAWSLPTPWYVKAAATIGAFVNTRLGAGTIGIIWREDDMEFSDFGLRDPIRLRHIASWVDPIYSQKYFHPTRLIGAITYGSLAAMVGFGAHAFHNWNPPVIPYEIRRVHCVSLGYKNENPARAPMYLHQKPAPKAVSLT